MVLGGTAGTCPADVGSSAREVKQTLIKFGVKMTCELELTSPIRAVVTSSLFQFKAASKIKVGLLECTVCGG